MTTPARINRPFVLLTGSTGLIGGLVLARLLSCGIPVCVLVRGNRRQSAAERVESLMRRLEERCNRLFVRPVVIAGDLCTAGLGLSDHDQHWIAANCSSVIHSAASLLFRPASEHSDHEPYRTNLEGTRHLLETTTRAGITEWHYVSTAYVSGVRGGTILETDGAVEQEFGNDYERSKMLAEDLLRTNPMISSLTVCRPSIVIDLYPASSVKADQSINTAYSMFQALSQRFGLPARGEWFRRLGFCGDERKNIVTADWVAQMIVQIFRRPALHAATYHLTSQLGISAADLEDSFRAAVAASGTRIPVWKTDAISQIDEQAAPLVTAFKPYFRDDPKFDRTNLTKAMQVCSEADGPDLTIEMLRDFCLRHSKPTLPIPTAPVERSPWELFAEASQTRVGDGAKSGRAGSNVDRDAKLADGLLGLELSGPGGGQWLIDGATDGLPVYAAAASQAEVRWIASAATFGRLVEGQMPLKEALDSGLLLIEVNRESDPVFSHSADSKTHRLMEKFGRLLAAVRRHGISHRRETAEVADVG